MKHGDAAATTHIAAAMVDYAMTQGLLCQLYEGTRPLLLGSSAYGSVPTASYALVQEMRTILARAGIPTDLVHIRRRGDFGCTSYGRLDLNERRSAMQMRHLDVSRADWQRMSGRPMLLIDDLRCSGAHEDSVAALLDRQDGPTPLVFFYWIGMSNRFASRDYDFEERLNHWSIQSYCDLLPLITQSLQFPHLNARLLKFVLLGGPNREVDRLPWFLDQLPEEAVVRLVQAATSSDGYAEIPAFQFGIRCLVARLQRRTTLPHAI